MSQYIWNVFISHGSEDKQSVARPLANRLAESGLKVWLDEAELVIGDSLREKIDEGLANSQFGVVILSPSFFAKNWPKSELDALVGRAMSGNRVILPIWHNMSAKDIAAISPLLSGLLAVSTQKGIEYVRNSVVEAIERRGKGKRIEEPIYAGKMTKRALLSLPEGSVLMSNTVNPDHSPTLTEEIGPLGAREVLWQKLKKDGSAGRRCYVFANCAGYRAHLAARSIWTA